MCSVSPLLRRLDSMGSGSSWGGGRKRRARRIGTRRARRRKWPEALFGELAARRCGVRSSLQDPCTSPQAPCSADPASMRTSPPRSLVWTECPSLRSEGVLQAGAQRTCSRSGQRLPVADLPGSERQRRSEDVQVLRRGAWLLAAVGSGCLCHICAINLARSN